MHSVTGKKGHIWEIQTKEKERNLKYGQRTYPLNVYYAKLKKAAHHVPSPWFNPS